MQKGGGGSLDEKEGVGNKKVNCWGSGLTERGGKPEKYEMKLGEKRRKGSHEKIKEKTQIKKKKTKKIVGECT